MPLLPVSSQIVSVSRTANRMLVRHFLGAVHNPEDWPEPLNCDTLAVPRGTHRDLEGIDAWVMAPEKGLKWPRRRTVIGASAYRLETNAEYDCGCRLVNVAEQFLRNSLVSPPELMIPIPRAQVYRPVDALGWCCERLARKLGVAHRPDLLKLGAPLADHPDKLSHRPLSWMELFELTRPPSVFDKRVVLCDWRWESGKTMTAVAKLLRKAGAHVVCFAWME